MANNYIDAPDWSTIPAPTDDGAAGHLLGIPIASVPLPATDGTTVDLSKLSGRTVVYIYPRTGRPGIPNPDGWDLIPGARGCTPESCSFRDHFAELKSLARCRESVRSFGPGYGLSTRSLPAVASALHVAIRRALSNDLRDALANV